MASTTLTVRLSPETKNKLAALSEITHRTRSFLAGEAIAEYVARELEIVAGIERGIDDLRSGRVVPHDDAMQRLRATAEKAASDD